MPRTRKIKPTDVKVTFVIDGLDPATPPIPLHEIGPHLADIRNRHDVSQAAIADYMGLKDPSSVSALERSRSAPTVETVRRYIEACVARKGTRQTP